MVIATEFQTQVLIDSWAQLSQDTLNQMTDQLPKTLTIVTKERVIMLNFVWT